MRSLGLMRRQNTMLLLMLLQRLSGYDGFFKIWMSIYHFQYLFIMIVQMLLRLHIMMSFMSTQYQKLIAILQDSTTTKRSLICLIFLLLLKQQTYLLNLTPTSASDFFYPNLICIRHLQFERRCQHILLFLNFISIIFFFFFKYVQDVIIFSISRLIMLILSTICLSYLVQQNIRKVLLYITYLSYI